MIFKDCSHAALYENTEEFNRLILLILTLGLLGLNFATPTNVFAGTTMSCEHDSDCDNDCLECDIGMCVCKVESKNRGQCISTCIAELCAGQTGQPRADCNHKCQEFCDECVDAGCT